MLHIPDNLDRRQATAAKKIHSKIQKAKSYAQLRSSGNMTANELLEWASQYTEEGKSA